MSIVFVQSNDNNINVLMRNLIYEALIKNNRLPYWEESKPYSRGNVKPGSILTKKRIILSIKNLNELETKYDKVFTFLVQELGQRRILRKKSTILIKAQFVLSFLISFFPKCPI